MRPRFYFAEGYGVSSTVETARKEEEEKKKKKKEEEAKKQKTETTRPEVKVEKKEEKKTVEVSQGGVSSVHREEKKEERRITPQTGLTRQHPKAISYQPETFYQPSQPVVERKEEQKEISPPTPAIQRQQEVTKPRVAVPETAYRPAETKKEERRETVEKETKRVVEHREEKREQPRTAPQPALEHRHPKAVSYTPETAYHPAEIKREEKKEEVKTKPAFEVRKEERREERKEEKKTEVRPEKPRVEVPEKKEERTEKKVETKTTTPTFDVVAAAFAAFKMEEKLRSEERRTEEKRVEEKPREVRKEEERHVERREVEKPRETRRRSVVEEVEREERRHERHYRPHHVHHEHRRESHRREEERPRRRHRAEEKLATKYFEKTVKVPVEVVVEVKDSVGRYIRDDVEEARSSRIAMSPEFREKGVEIPVKTQVLVEDSLSLFETKDLYKENKLTVELAPKYEEEEQEEPVFIDVEKPVDVSLPRYIHEESSEERTEYKTEAPEPLKTLLERYSRLQKELADSLEQLPRIEQIFSTLGVPVAIDLERLKKLKEEAEKHPNIPLLTEIYQKALKEVKDSIKRSLFAYLAMVETTIRNMLSKVTSPSYASKLAEYLDRVENYKARISRAETISDLYQIATDISRDDALTYIYKHGEIPSEAVKKVLGEMVEKGIKGYPKIVEDIAKVYYMAVHLSEDTWRRIKEFLGIRPEDFAILRKVVEGEPLSPSELTRLYILSQKLEFFKKNVAPDLWREVEKEFREEKEKVFNIKGIEVRFSPSKDILEAIAKGREPSVPVGALMKWGLENIARNLDVVGRVYSFVYENLKDKIGSLPAAALANAAAIGATIAATTVGGAVGGATVASGIAGYIGASSLVNLASTIAEYVDDPYERRLLVNYIATHWPELVVDLASVIGFATAGKWLPALRNKVADLLKKAPSEKIRSLADRIADKVTLKLADFIAQNTDVDVKIHGNRMVITIRQRGVVEGKPFKIELPLKGELRELIKVPEVRTTLEKIIARLGPVKKEVVESLEEALTNFLRSAPKGQISKYAELFGKALIELISKGTDIDKAIVMLSRARVGPEGRIIFSSDRAIVLRPEGAETIPINNNLAVLYRTMYRLSTALKVPMHRLLDMLRAVLRGERELEIRSRNCAVAMRRVGDKIEIAVVEPGEIPRKYEVSINDLRTAVKTLEELSIKLGPNRAVATIGDVVKAWQQAFPTLGSEALSRINFMKKIVQELGRVRSGEYTEITLGDKEGFVSLIVNRKYLSGGQEHILDILRGRGPSAERIVVIDIKLPEDIMKILSRYISEVGAREGRVGIRGIMKAVDRAIAEARARGDAKSVSQLMQLKMALKTAVEGDRMVAIGIERSGGVKFAIAPKNKVELAAISLASAMASRASLKLSDKEVKEIASRYGLTQDQIAQATALAYNFLGIKPSFRSTVVSIPIEEIITVTVPKQLVAVATKAEERTKYVTLLPVFDKVVVPEIREVLKVVTTPTTVYGSEQELGATYRTILLLPKFVTSTIPQAVETPRLVTTATKQFVATDVAEAKKSLVVLRPEFEEYKVSEERTMFKELTKPLKYVLQPKTVYKSLISTVELEPSFSVERVEKVVEEERSVSVGRKEFEKKSVAEEELKTVELEPVLRTSEIQKEVELSIQRTATTQSMEPEVVQTSTVAYGDIVLEETLVPDITVITVPIGEEGVSPMPTPLGPFPMPPIPGLGAGAAGIVKGLPRPKEMRERVEL